MKVETKDQLRQRIATLESEAEQMQEELRGKDRDREDLRLRFVAERDKAHHQYQQGHHS